MVPRRGTGCFRPTGRDGGLHPPFSFVLPKENAPCTVEEKSASGAYGTLTVPSPRKSGGWIRRGYEGYRRLVPRVARLVGTLNCSNHRTP